MKRRQFIGGLAGSAAWPLIAPAQQNAMGVVGFLHPATLESTPTFVVAFRKGVAERGYLEGQNVSIDYRFAKGQYDRLPALASELVRRRVDLIAALGGDPSVVAAKAATASIPIVFSTGSDPVSLGLVASLNRPGGNITAINQLTGLIAPKQLELMHELLPQGAVIGIIENRNNPAVMTRAKELRAAAHALGRTIQIVNAGNETELDSAFSALAGMHAGGFLIVGDSILLSLRNHIVALATRHAVPALYSRREYVEVGGLMSYGASLTEAYHLAGAYAGRILKGEKPADLPVQQSSKLELIINLKAANGLGFRLPDSLLRRADEVIE